MDFLAPPAVRAALRDRVEHGIFGYARPVPVRFGNLNNPKRDMIWVALAGPAMNFFQALSWLDNAKRSQVPSAIHYAAFELRYGIEYLLFELLVLANKNLTQVEYERCLGDPNEMKRCLRHLELTTIGFLNSPK